MKNITKGNSIPIQHSRNPFLAMQQELDKAMDNFLHWFETPKYSLQNFENSKLFPSLDIIDEKDHIKVEAEMPGLGEKDIQVSISDGMLTIKGEKTTSTKDKNKNYLMREISFGSYERSIALPTSADSSKAKATFKKGMLWVDIPKRSEAIKQAKEIKVEKVN